MLLAAGLTGWWIGYAVGAAIVIVVALLLLTIIATARRIAATAADATQALVQARDRTEALWQVNTTKALARDILAAAVEGRAALGGDVGEGVSAGGAHAPGEDLRGAKAQERAAIKHSLDQSMGPQLSPEEET